MFRSPAKLFSFLRLIDFSVQEVDYIIVGQGLAGSATAVQLLKRNRKILVIDQPAWNSSSRIAAGLVNPVTGRKMVKTWMADVLFPYLHQFYRDVEERTGARFFYSLPLYRPFISIEEQNEWMSKSAEPGYVAYIDKVLTASSLPYVKDAFGGLMLKQCGYLDTTSYITAVQKWIDRDGIFLNENFDPQQLTMDPEGVRYKNFSGRKIIFCQGSFPNEMFSWLPLRPLKGETIRIKTDVSNTVMINRGVYMVPGGLPGEWRVGATYDFKSNAPGTTPEARLELEEKMRELTDFPFECIGQEWGLRPTTPDRRPMLGSHPEFPAMVIFNGLGTKGVSLSPYFSEVLVHWFENKIPLNKEVDIERYKSLYWTSPK